MVSFLSLIAQQNMLQNVDYKKISLIRESNLNLLGLCLKKISQIETILTPDLSEIQDCKLFRRNMFVLVLKNSEAHRWNIMSIVY